MSYAPRVACSARHFFLRPTAPKKCPCCCGALCASLFSLPIISSSFWISWIPTTTMGSSEISAELLVLAFCFMECFGKEILKNSRGKNVNHLFSFRCFHDGACDQRHAVFSLLERNGRSPLQRLFNGL